MADSRTSEDTLRLAAQVTRTGIQPHEMNEIYDTWAKTYDQDLRRVDYNGPRQMADHMAGVIPSEHRSKVRILDFGSGTGLVGKELKDHGFTQVDALDPNTEMLKQAEAKGAYTNLIQAYLGPHQTSIPNDTYDHCVSVGCFNEGHIKSDCFPELIRITHPGGSIQFTIGEKVLGQIPEYRDNLQQAIDKLVQKGVWRQEETQILHDYFLKTQGLLYRFTVLNKQ